MAGHHPWRNLTDKLTPEQRRRVEQKSQAMRIGMLIAELREERGMTQQQIADQLGVTQPCISQIEAGQEIQLTTLRKIITALGGEIILKLPGRQVSLDEVFLESVAD